MITNNNTALNIKHLSFLSTLGLLERVVRSRFQVFLDNNMMAKHNLPVPHTAQKWHFPNVYRLTMICC